MVDDHHWMHQALLEAKRGLYTAHPNPRVGCVFVKNNQIIARGYHHQTGQDHAEIQAIKQAETSLEGSTCYVTLEPCAHTGLTPPCVDALLKLNLARCVIAMRDPNPLVNGLGIQKLQQAGVETTVGVLEYEARCLNEGFIKRIQSSKPKVTVKVGASLDGKTALLNGQSQWITSSESRVDVQSLRAQVGAVISTAQTVRRDNAKLTVRDEQLTSLVGFKQPLRVVLDRCLTLDPSLDLFKHQGPIWIVVDEALSSEKKEAFMQNFDASQVQLVPVPSRLNAEQKPILDFESLLLMLGKECNEVLVEAGSQLLGFLAAHNLIDEMRVYFAPKLLGSEAFSMFQFGIPQLDAHIPFKIHSFEKVGPDLKIIVKRDDV